MEHTAYISLGSNIGNKLENCQKGVESLTSSGESVVKAWSQFYKTEPVDYKDQDWFVNAVVKIETILDPFELLHELKSIELSAGRDNDSVRFGPRILDMDIILYGNVVINGSSKLQLPHPRMHKRRFVLKPICDIDPGIVHPVLKTDVKSLLNSLADKEQRIIQLQKL